MPAIIDRAAAQKILEKLQCIQKSDPRDEELQVLIGKLEEGLESAYVTAICRNDIVSIFEESGRTEDLDRVNRITTEELEEIAVTMHDQFHEDFFWTDLQESVDEILFPDEAIGSDEEDGDPP